MLELEHFQALLLRAYQGPDLLPNGCHQGGIWDQRAWSQEAAGS